MKTPARIGTLFLLACTLLLPAGLRQAPTASAQGVALVVTKSADTADGACDADCSLREAITAANAAGTATITLPAGTYVLTRSGRGEDAALTGDLDIIGNVTIAGAGLSSTIIDGGGLDRVFHVSPGGGLIVSGVTIRNGAVSHPSNSDLGNGGGIFNAGTLTLKLSAVAGNAAGAGTSLGAGGGIFNASGAALTVFDSTISGNVVGGQGGGAIANFGTLTIDRSTISGNTATGGGHGGGLYNPAGTITNSTITGNSALQGGGIRASSRPLTLLNTTLTANAASPGSGISNEVAPITLLNSIVHGCSGPMQSGGRNLSPDGSCGLTAAGDLPNTDPRLGPLADNGGPTLTHALLPGSPAIDAASGCPAADQRGTSRPQGPACDIGAFERAVPVDTVPPVIACATPDAQWHSTDVAIACTASDQGTGLANAGDSSFSLTTSVPTGTETASAATGSRNVCDLAGNCAIAGPIAGNKVDKKPPVTTAVVTGTTGGAGWFKAGEPVRLTLASNDGGSGVAATTYRVNGGAAQSYASPLTFADGEYTVTYSSTDQAGNIELTKTVSFKVDQTPPTITCTASPNSLWPPNHQLIPVTISVTLDDGGSGVAGYTLTSVTSSEPDFGLGAGDTAGDIQGFVVGTADAAGELRAERAGSGPGRVYTLTYSAADRAGNNATCAATVTVPHDEGKK